MLFVLALVRLSTPSLLLGVEIPGIVQISKYLSNYVGSLCTASHYSGTTFCVINRSLQEQNLIKL